jgi:DNA repair exonuclease SbcCD ATPase subunit
VDDLDPIKRLQSLLDDRGKVLEKISGIHSALNSIKSLTIPAGVQPLNASMSERESFSAGDNAGYERMLQTLSAMRSQIEDRVLPLAQQAVKTEADRLRQKSEQEQAALQDCIARIDECVLTCAKRMQEYQRRTAELNQLNEKLAALGVACEPLPQDQFAQDLGETIILRLQSLQLAGKF